MNHGEVLGHFIGGQTDAMGANQFRPVNNPATGQATKRIPTGSTEAVTAATKAAEEAFPGWADTPAPRRARVLSRFLELARSRRDELAEAITEEHGKTLDDARGEVQRGLEVVEFACGIPQLLKGEYSQNVGRGVDSYSMRQPLGVVVGITPFNFPVMVPLWMIPVALATGNTFVLKPSEEVPSAALLMGRWLREAGLPDGVFNVVFGERAEAQALIDDPRVQAVSFVGSTPAAQAVQKQATAAGKRVQALGGAKNHMVILPDADLEKAADALLGAAFGAAGQRCMAVSVAVPVGDCAGPFMEVLVEKAKALTVGPGTDSQSDFGPLITAVQKQRVEMAIENGREEGADLVLDGRRVSVPGHDGGYFMGPTIFDRVAPHMNLYLDEIFGPVLSVVRQNSAEEALELANKHAFGNGFSVFTESGAAGRTFAHRAEAGMVGINVPIPVPMAFHSFGGWKNSIFGDHAIHGPEGVRFYTKLKTVTQRWDGDNTAKAGFAMPTAK